MTDPHRLIVYEQQGRLRVGFQRAGEVVPALTDPRPWGPPLTDPPLTDDELTELRWYLETYLLAPYGVYQDRGPTIQEYLPVWGHRLFDALFGEPKSREIYGRAVEAAAAEPGVELVLVSSSPAFLRLPWEMIYAPGDRWLADDLRGITRQIELTHRAHAVPADGALRVLMVIARPGGVDDVPFQVVARPLMERLGAIGGEVRLDVLRPPTLDALRDRLLAARDAQEPYHLVHFDGHGGFGPAAPAASTDPPQPDRHRYPALEGRLLFERADGAEDPIGAEALGAILRDAKVPVFVLNACRSAAHDPAAGAEASVATRLLHHGARAVVAMSYSVYAVAAAEFMAALYDALFRGRPLGDAVRAGRAQLRRAPDRPSPKGPLPLADWMVPVHYARGRVAFPHLAAAARPRGLDATLAALRQPGAAAPLTEDPLAPIGRFIGRDAELLQLERALRRHRVAVLHGVGGAGKTELAKAFARWWRDTGGVDDPRLVFVHSFEPGGARFGVDLIIDQIAHQLGLAQLPAAQREPAVLQLLTQHRALLIWDNFETACSMPDPDGVTPPLDDAARAALRRVVTTLARHARGGLIITSRSPEPWLGDDQTVARLPIGGLAPEDAACYVDTLCADAAVPPARRADAAFADLLGWLGGHPLSLRLMIPRLARTPAAALLAALRGEAALPTAFEAGDGRLASLGACVHYSFRHLDPADQRRLPALALFEQVVDANVLAMMSAHDAAPARLRGVDRAAWGATLDRCAALGLLAPLPISGTYRLHPALPPCLAEWWAADAGDAAPAERAAALDAAIAAHAAFGDWLDQQYQRGDAALALRALELERATLGRMAAAALTAGRHAEAQAILQPLNELWKARGLDAEFRGWAARCRAATEAPDGAPPDLDTAAGALWLFIAGADAGRAVLSRDLDRAEAAYEALRVALETSDADAARPRLAVAYHQLGMVAEQRAAWDAAEAWYRRSLTLKEALDDRRGQAASWHQLGNVAQERGDLEAAEERSRRALTITEEVGDRPRMARTYHQLGIVAQSQGHTEAAEGWYRRSLALNEALGDRPGMAGCYHQLGRLAQSQGHTEAAEGWYRRSLALNEALGDRSGMASSYHQLGRVAQSLGDFEAAEGWYRRSLALKEALGNRPGMALTCAQLALLDDQRGDPAAALGWAVRPVGWFGLGHRATGAASKHLLDLTARLGLDALRGAWQQAHGAPLPAELDAAVTAALAD